MTDFIKRRTGHGPTDSLAQDIESSFSNLQGTVGKYTPRTLTDWADPPPTTIQEALDRLAASSGTPP